MNMELLKAIVTYKGDIISKLQSTKSKCPNRLVNGNTEQEVDVFRGGASTNEELADFAKSVESIILNECSKNGDVLGLRWCMAESP